MSISHSDARGRRILIVDDHPIVRDGLCARIGAETDLSVCGETDNAGDAIRLVREARPHAAVVDISLKSGNGIDLVGRLKKNHEGVRVLVHSMYEETLYAERALHAGAMGYLNKQDSADYIIPALRRLLDGKIYLSEKMSQRLLMGMAGAAPSDQPAVARLSNRELQVFELIGEGQSTKEAAERLKISPKTVETHRENIKSKLGLDSTLRLTHYAIRWMADRGRGASEE